MGHKGVLTSSVVMLTTLFSAFSITFWLTTVSYTHLYETIALNEIKRIGYTEEYHVHTVVNQQSPEIHNAVNRDEVCAGDQGIMRCV